MSAEKTKLTWTERYRRDPDLAQSIVETLQRSLVEADARIDKLEAALERISSGDWTTIDKDLRNIAKEALE